MPFHSPARLARRLCHVVAAVAMAAACATALAQTQTPAAPPPADAASPPATGTAPRVPRSRQPFNMPGPEQVTRRVETVDAAVTLTPEQRTKVTALYQAESDRMIAINAKYAGKDSAPDQRRAKAGEMGDVVEDTRAKLATLLTPAQAKQWTAYVQERRERNRTTFRHNSQHAGATHSAPATGAPTSGTPTGAPPMSAAPK